MEKEIHGAFMNNKKLLLPLAATVALALSPVAYSVSLSDLNDSYDVFVIGDATRGSRVHGSLAVGGDLTIGASDFSVNDDGNHTSVHSLVVGGAVNVDNNGGKVLSNGGRGTVRIGTIKSSQSLNPGSDINLTESFTSPSSTKALTFYNGTQSVSDIVDDNVVDFSSSYTALKNLSDGLRGLGSTLTPAGSDLIFDFNLSAGLQVINLTAAQFNLFSQTNLLGSLSSGARFLVNVDLTGFSGILGQNTNQNVSDSFASGILWNFFGNNDVEIRSKWVGSILAPDVDILDNTSGDIRGSVIANSLTKVSGQIHAGSFDFEFPDPAPEPPVSVSDSGATGLLVLVALPVVFAVRRRIK